MKNTLPMRIAAFFTAFFLVFLSSVAHNLWIYEIGRLEREEGTWQGRITASLTDEDLEVLRNFGGVASVTYHLSDSPEEEPAADIVFETPARALTDLPRMAQLLDLGTETLSFHHSLLAMYFVRDPADPAPRLVFPLLAGLTLLACFALALLLRSTFTITLDAGVRQAGLLSSLGATPRQIRWTILRHAAVLCAPPLLLGIVPGLGFSWLLVHASNQFDLSGRVSAVWRFHPAVTLLALLLAVLTLLLSALGSVRRLGKVTPLEAIGNAEQVSPARRRHNRLGQLFGVEGELAQSGLRTRRKALRTASLSLTVSLLAFLLMLNFFTLSDISTQMTYFARYQNAWDLLFTFPDTPMEEVGSLSVLRSLPEISDSLLFQRAEAVQAVPAEDLADPSALPDSLREGDLWNFPAPLRILDDGSFIAWCSTLGIEPRLDGTILLNRVADFADPNFRSRAWLPALKDTVSTAHLLSRKGTGSCDLPILAQVQNPPLLREEYGTETPDLVHFLPLSLWQKIRADLGPAEEDCVLRILSAERSRTEDLDRTEAAVRSHLNSALTPTVENRLREYSENQVEIQGVMFLFGSFCVLLGAIGVSSVFAVTFTFARRRQREVARCLSLGMTPGGVYRMFLLEALFLLGRPLLIALPLAAVATWAMCQASYLKLSLFLAQAPVIPVLLFLLALCGSTVLACVLGGRTLLHTPLPEILRDESLL